MGRRSLVLMAATAGIFCLMPAPANAVLPAGAERAATGSANPGRVQEQFEDQTVLPQVSPRVDVKDLMLQQAPPGSDNIRFRLAGVEMDGVTAYSPGVLDSVFAQQLGTTISLTDVYGIAAALTTKYRNEGYILTQVVVPPQTIEGGMVRLHVVEGFVDNVSIQGDGSETEMSMVRTYASHIQTGQPLNVRDLERHLLLIDDLPGVSARSVLSPSKTRTGAADLRVIVSRDPYDALIAADNFGSRYLGPIQFTGAAAANSFIGYNDRISGQVVMAPDPGQGFNMELAYFALGYEQPVFDNGTKVQVNFNHTNTEPGFDLKPFNVEGISRYMNVGITHPFIRTRSENLYGRAIFDMRDVESTNNIEPKREDSIRAARLGGRYEFLDRLIGVGINSIDVEVAKGLGIFGASDKGDANLSRAAGDPQFLKINAEIQRLQRITGNLNLLAVVRGQVSRDPLLASEEFGVGGVNIGRGYDPSEIVGDDGVAGKVELQWNKPYQWNFVQDYQLFSFFDAGKVWNQDATTSILKQNTATSAGFGIRADFMEQTEAGLAVAFPLNRDVQTQGDKDPKVYFNLSRRF
jgi:hemolysin activation/secretion protein